MYLLPLRAAQVREALLAAHAAAQTRGALPAGPTPAFVVEPPREGAHGDLASNLALVLASACGLAPRLVAGRLAEQIPTALIGDFERVEIAGPGFLNFSFRPGWLTPVVAEVLRAKAAYGRSERGAGRRVLVEFVSANPTGPLNVVNCRAAAFGDSLVRSLRAVGYAAEAEYYVNDAGGQFRRLAQSLEARLRQRRGEAVGIPDGGYPGEYLLAVAEAFARAHGDAVLDQPPAEREEQLGRYAVRHLLEQQRADLARFRVHYDHFSHEADIRADGAPERVIAALRERGRTVERDGALWLVSTAGGDNDDRVLRKSNGELTYRVPDIAYHASKFERGYDRLIDIYGPDHHGEVLAVSLALQWLGYPTDRLEVVITQVIRLVEGGREVKISKRAGAFVSMAEFLDDVGVDAARFFFLLRTADSHLDFDLALARRQSQDNPVYYVQYAHARICSILKASGDGPATVPSPEGLLHPAEVALCRTLGSFPLELEAAAEGRAPHRLAIFARAVAERFHVFYAQCRVLTDDPVLRASRLALCRATQIVLGNTLDILGVSAPEQM